MVTEGIDVGDYVVQNMNMGVATELGDWADTVDGVLGMGFQSRNSGRCMVLLLGKCYS